jgi:hypothetical protein
MTLFWKNATAVLCGAVVCTAAITWQVHRAKTNEQKLAETAREFAEHAKECRARAKQGDARAQFDLGNIYYHGQGVPQDYTEAFRWYRKAADQGYAGGEDGLGYMYLYGLGVPQDYAEALRWYRKAADHGDAKGQNAVALMYEQGQGVSQDYAEAFRWYRKAVDQGYAAAQYNLGNMYFYGRGVPQDRAEAARWYQRAADQGDDYAQRVLHIKWKGLSIFSKVSLSLIFLGSSFFFVGSLVPGGSYRDGQRRRLTLAGLLGLCYVALDLLGFRYIGILTPVLALGAFRLFKSLIAGISVALLLSVAFPKNLWPKVVKFVLGIVVILVIGLNIFMISVYKLRHLIPPLRSFWLINAHLLGMIIALAVALWLANKGHNETEPQCDVAASDSPIEDNEGEP